jgi:hypothetical protein
MLRVFQQSYHIPGALSANVGIRFTAPFDMQLIHVSASQSDTDTATIKIGTSADDDGYLVASNFGVSGTPAEFDRDNFTGALIVSGQYPHIAKGTIVVITITDHGSHSNDPTVVLTFTEG